MRLASLYLREITSKFNSLCIIFWCLKPVCYILCKNTVSSVELSNQIDKKFIFFGCVYYCINVFNIFLMCQIKLRTHIPVWVLPECSFLLSFCWILLSFSFSIDFVAWASKTGLQFLSFNLQESLNFVFGNKVFKNKSLKALVDRCELR